MIGGLTGFIAKHAGVSYWVAAAIKYVAITGIVGGTLLYMKSGYDADKRQEGYDKCQAQYQEAITETKEEADKVSDARDEVIDQGRQEQRSFDTVSRQEFNALKREKEYDKIEFERELRKARQATNDDSVNCANVDMPIGLQRHVKTQASDGALRD